MSQIHEMQVQYFDSINFTLFDRISIGFGGEERLLLWDGSSKVRVVGPAAGMDDHLVLQVSLPFDRRLVLELQSRLKQVVTREGVYLTIPETFQMSQSSS